MSGRAMCAESRRAVSGTRYVRFDWATHVAGQGIDADVREQLEALYRDIDSVEWHVGIFAEDCGQRERQVRLTGDRHSDAGACGTSTRHAAGPRAGGQRHGIAAMVRTGQDQPGAGEEPLVPRGARRYVVPRELTPRH